MKSLSNSNKQLPLVILKVMVLNLAYFKKLPSVFLSLPFSFTMSDSTRTNLKPTSSSASDECHGFASLLAKELYTDTEAFLTVYRTGMMESVAAKRVTAFSRFIVESITSNKQMHKTSQHEHISVAVRDENTGRKHNFFFERTASSLSVSSLSPRSESMSSTLSLTSVGQLGEGHQRESASPGIPPSSSESAPSLSPPPRTIFKKPSKLSLTEMASVSSIDLLHSSATSLSLHGIAEDRVFGDAVFLRKSESDTHLGVVTRQISPIGLSLFELGILADVIHKHQPDYNLFRNQCYWFTSVIVAVVEVLHGNSLDVPSGPHMYLPDLSGRWNGILVSNVEGKELSKIAGEYIKRRTEEFNNVGFTIFYSLI